MLSFATEFPVSETSSRQFVEAVKLWIVGSPHTAFTRQQIDCIPSSGRWKVETATQRLEGLFASSGAAETAAFRHVAVDGAIEWITEVSYSKSETDDWVGVRTSRESDRPQLSLPPAKKPLLVRTLINSLGGGLDDELYVSDQPYFLREQDERMAARLLNADADNYLPIVYISCPFAGESPLNANSLARVLGELAHVVVEPSREFSRSIQRAVGSRNVYGGAIGVYWPSGERYRYFVDNISQEFDVRQALVADIRQSLLNRRPIARCTWSRAEAEVARSVFEALRTSGSEDVSEYVAAFDSEIAAKDRQLEEANKEVHRLNARVRAQAGYDQTQVMGLNFGNEQELHKGEFSEILQDALNAAVENAQDGGRRQHVLVAAAAALPNSTEMKSRRDKIKEILKNYTSMTAEIRSSLERLGFSISEDGKHVKITYMSDERYVFILPKSGSDHRGGLNSVSDISKRVF